MRIPPLQAAYESFLTTGDARALLDAIHAHGRVAPSPELDCPLAHRVHDIDLCGSWYRVVRVVTLPEGSTELLIYPTDTPGESSGVPYSLVGSGLLRWVHDELDDPTDDPTDWGVYFDGS